MIALPKRPKINYAITAKPNDDKPSVVGDEEEKKTDEVKSKKPPIAKQERSVRSVSRKGLEVS